ncbi:hypothetical protein TNCV_951951 [Trichonephila clavipes]|nr:hypothetical protein TNCV_951951 [Trichonephila clavipes]
MGWFVSFSETLTYLSTAIISPQMETRFIHEQHPMQIDDPGTMTMIPRQASNPVLSGLKDTPFAGTHARNCTSCNLLHMVWLD